MNWKLRQKEISGNHARARNVRLAAIRRCEIEKQLVIKICGRMAQIFRTIDDLCWNLGNISIRELTSSEEELKNTKFVSRFE